MEGPWKPWRTQKIENNSPDLDSYGKPLPSPPLGYYWERLPDKSWELKKYLDSVSSPDQMVFDAPAIVEHVILPTDTLQGICLRYRVTAVTLRQYNNFSGTSFRSRKYLRIPVEPGLPINVQISSQDILIQRFKNETGESEKEARYYLEERNWNLNEALAEWTGDENWMSQQLPISVFQSPTIAPRTVVAALASDIPYVIPLSVTFDHPMCDEIDLSSEPLLGRLTA
jgi:hypothetical protein